MIKNRQSDDISDLVGETLAKVKNRDNEFVIFTLANGDRYALCHQEDCCENVYVADIAGDLNDLVGSPILKAEESSQHFNEGDYAPKNMKSEGHESWTWTFYLLATVKGYVTIRWYGGSNGYYSEEVEFGRILKEEIRLKCHDEEGWT